MKLAFRKHGIGEPLLILHGLFGQSDNWNSLAIRFAEQGFCVYTADLRNHGLSPHSNDWSYSLMAEDVAELIIDEKLRAVNLVGHSMGGMTAMHLAVSRPELLNKLLVVDMAPKVYPPHHEQVIAGLKSVDFSHIKTRKEAAAQLSKYISDEPTKQFLLKNIFWKDEQTLAWRFNLPVIETQYKNLNAIFDTDTTRCYTPASFIRGGRSNYILDSDWPLIHQVFPDSQLYTIPNAGHWIHAEAPEAFYQTTLAILQDRIPASLPKI
jgi:esterase